LSEEGNGFLLTNLNEIEEKLNSTGRESRAKTPTLSVEELGRQDNIPAWASPSYGNYLARGSRKIGVSDVLLLSKQPCEWGRWGTSVVCF